MSESLTLSDPQVPKPGYKTSEFGATAVALAGNVLAVLAAIGVISHADRVSIEMMVGTVVANLAAAIPAVVGLIAYIRSRTTVKVAAAQEWSHVQTKSMRLAFGRLDGFKAGPKVGECAESYVEDFSGDKHEDFKADDRSG